jgi:peptide/nickel transport system substrate-binding protein
VTRTRNWARLAVAAAVVLALAAAGCAGDEEGGGEAEGTTPAATTGTTDRKFDNLRIAFGPGVDYLDPGLSYTADGWGVMWNVYLSLLTYKHVNGPDGATIIPALAEALPEVSDDNLTYSLTLREGLTYSDGTPVKASDFEATVKRLFLLDSPGVGFFSNVAGAARFGETKQGDISGITSDDAARTIEIRLEKPQGDFMNVLASSFASLVPASAPAEDQSTTPLPATGPYMIESYLPNREIVLVRNPEYEELDGIPAGNPDRMTFTVIEDDSAALQSVIDGENDYDFHSIPIDRLGEVQSEHGDQLRLYIPANTYFYFLNTRVKPFDKLEVRQAVNHAIDRSAEVRLFGGLATETQNVLPPTYPQFEKIDMYPYDEAKAKQLVEDSGYKGMDVTVFSGGGSQQRAAEYLLDVLTRIGFKAKMKVVDPSVYLQTIGNQATKAQTGVANWFQDYPHPLNWFDVLLNGNRITETHNSNYSNADVPEINAKIEELKQEPVLTDEVNEEWAEVDRMVMENALWAPYVNRQFTDFFAADMDVENCYVNHVLYLFDYPSACKKAAATSE